MRISEAIRKYVAHRSFELSVKSLPNDIRTLLQFAVFMRDSELETVELQHIHDYVGLMLSVGFDKNTAYRKANSFKQFFDFWFKQGVRVVNPDILPKIKMAHRQPRVATEEEYCKFMDAIPAEGFIHVRNACLASMLYDTYARVNEILPLRLDQINDDVSGAVIRTEKIPTGEKRRIFWREKTKERLLVWLKIRSEKLQQLKAVDRGELYIIAGGGNSSYTEPYRQLRYEGAKAWFRKYSINAGLPRTLNPHSLRHKGGQEMAEQDYDPYVIASILGHKTIDSSLEYARLYGDRLRRKYYQIKKY